MRWDILRFVSYLNTSAAGWLRLMGRKVQNRGLFITMDLHWGETSERHRGEAWRSSSLARQSSSTLTGPNAGSLC